jgi:hypothetical protein
MRNASRAAIDDAILYSEIAALRDDAARLRLTQLSSDVMATYSDYESASAKVTTLTPKFSSPDGDLLRQNWPLLARVSVSYVRPAVFLTSNGRCCLCNNSKAGQIDHYLPQAKYPEFVVYTGNFVPACDRCNKKKGTRYRRNALAGPAFLHPRLHALPSGEQYLQVSVSLDRTVLVEYSVMQTASMPSGRYQTLRSHFSLLGLATLYSDEAVLALSEMLGAFYAYYREGGAAAVSRYLARDAGSRRKFLGMNHWKPVLLGALSLHGEFCDGGFKILGPEEFID